MVKQTISKDGICSEYGNVFEQAPHIIHNEMTEAVEGLRTSEMT